ncbi:MAG: bifunctional 23S rRNA (guanine(2069)-N(7))-methyltransferase RlmK/23S rRNA (guanine(2445)-N(2))-methyltransferase RlmL [Candidatus Latescibacteria bacterium]|nr:bifunctional 23S rRNA (guanine(2069)-N(7))-methyltransferase RlmK/23S rRNA (guanine(2445)-N(2))-methyltransferase RlmL [Candidatus Latescibacterota bacterium]
MPKFFATTPRGMEPLLAGELQAMGATEVETDRSGVWFAGELEIGYRACLWSRTASRILLELARFPAADSQALYHGVGQLDWETHLAPEGTLAVDCTAGETPINHTHFAALRVKDAIVDQFRQAHGVRPSVELARPDLRLHLHLAGEEATLSLDLAGESLHRRGYRQEGLAAPLKENLAAAILLRADWPAIAQRGGSLLDPLCGSGTLLIEGALMAADSPPGWGRTYWGFEGWKGHQPKIWEALLAEAGQRRAAGRAHIPLIRGCDADPQAIRAARANAARAGLEGAIQFEQGAFAQVGPEGPAGLVVANPPYGERLGQERELARLYLQLGEVLKERFGGWQAALFAGNVELRIPLRPRRSYTLYNGALRCRLLIFSLDATPRQTAPPPPVPQSPGAQMLRNRLKRNVRLTGRWAQRQGISCFRLYDADLPEYALAVDLYQGETTWAHVQEYQAPTEVDEGKATARREEALALLPLALEIPPEHLFFKMRRRQRGKAQYEKQAAEGRFYEVREGGCRFLVNFTDYLDTGLFLDHRLTRALIGELAGGRRFLNLFGYTGTATVHAALGGAMSTTTVDLSRTYLDWAQRNLTLNGFERGNDLVQADCLEWLRQAERERRRYGLIFLDPPTFSNSKRMEETLDIQRDHGELIQGAARLLEPEGILLFSTNNRRFKLDQEALAGLAVEDLSRKTLPEDFARNPRIHQCWRLERQS